MQSQAQESQQEAAHIRVEMDVDSQDAWALAQAPARLELLAVSKALEALLSNRDPEIFQALLSQTPRYVRSSTIRDEDKGSGLIHFEADVSIYYPMLRHDLARLLKPKLPFAPEAVVLIEEICTRRDHALRGVAEKHLAKELIDKGTTVHDSARIRTRYGNRSLASHLAGEWERAGRLARALPGDVAVLGLANITSKMLSETSPLLEVEVVMTLRVVRTRDGSTQKTLSSHAKVSSLKWEDGAAQALRDACDKTAKGLAEAVTLCAAGTPGREGMLVEIVGPGSRLRTEAIRDMLEDLAGAAQVTELYYSERLVCFDLRWAGSVQELLISLSEPRAADLGLHVEQVVGKRVTLSLQPLKR